MTRSDTQDGPAPLSAIADAALYPRSVWRSERADALSQRGAFLSGPNSVQPHDGAVEDAGEPDPEDVGDEQERRPPLVTGEHDRRPGGRPQEHDDLHQSHHGQFRAEEQQGPPRLSTIWIAHGTVVSAPPPARHASHPARATKT